MNYMVSNGSTHVNFSSCFLDFDLETVRDTVRRKTGPGFSALQPLCEESLSFAEFIGRISLTWR
jgi:hypothetical protein